MPDFQLTRLGLLMEPEPGNANEVEGTLNPAAIRGKDGHLYLFPRLVAKGNYSRIGVARVLFDEKGDPTGVERLGIALEPEADYELRSGGGGGCEDPRVTYVEPLGHYVMTYVAFSPRGPRIAIAISEDLIHWERIGLATFEPYDGIEFDGVDNKDSCIFPLAIPGPSGRPSLGLLHRPLFNGTRPEEIVRREEPELVDLERESIWISYRDMEVDRSVKGRLSHFTSHHRLAIPTAGWEKLKIGVGAPPVLTDLGWVVVYHGVQECEDVKHALTYSAGVMVLSKENPRTILYRSEKPVLTPELESEKIGTIGNVVFPTGIDRRDDLNTPGRLDVYYGMADDRIGVARMDLPSSL